MVEASREELARFFTTVLPHLNELQRRVVAGAMSQGLGHGGKSAVAEASGMSRNTVIKAEREVEVGIEPSASPACGRWRGRQGRGEAAGSLAGARRARATPRRAATRCPSCAGPRSRRPSSPRTSSARASRSPTTPSGRILRSLGYSLQAPVKQKEGAAHPDRDAQFVYLNDEVGASRQPASR